jgi:hypothetical protein
VAPCSPRRSPSLRPSAPSPMRSREWLCLLASNSLCSAAVEACSASAYGIP